MAAKKNSFITDDLEWAEQQLSTWKAYIDGHPIHELTDRNAWKELKGGGRMPVVVASIEQQITSIRQTMKDYLALLEIVDKLREREEEKKVKAKGDAAVSSLAEEWLTGRDK